MPTSVRDERCPICHGDTTAVLSQRFGEKLRLPDEVPVRSCEADNFLFNAAGLQVDYDGYYSTVVNDAAHDEVPRSDAARSAFAQRQACHLGEALGAFFATPRKVLDFGCGQAALLVELALAHPESAFFGLEVSPAAKTALGKIESLQLGNLAMVGMAGCRAEAPYNCIVLSHVIEHVLDLDLIEMLSSLLAEDGLLYVEVPDAEKYGEYARREFLYYFDRLHVNHFSPQALSRLFGRYGMRHTGYFRYSVPYRENGEYPDLGMLFHKGESDRSLASESLLHSTREYIQQEKVRAGRMRMQLRSMGGVLVWGGGDNFCRSLQNGGPLEDVAPMVLMDRCPRRVSVAGRSYEALEPSVGLEKHSWPVLITVPDVRGEIRGQILASYPHRQVLLA